MARASRLAPPEKNEIYMRLHLYDRAGIIICRPERSYL